MKKFRVMIVKKNGQPVGVRAATINSRTIVLALCDELQQMSWYDAVKIGIPTKEEWCAIFENLEEINKAFIRAGKKPLPKGWYWSSSELSSNYAWFAKLGNSILSYDIKKFNNYYVLPVLAL